MFSLKKIDSFPLIWFQTLLDKVLQTCKEYGVNAIVEYFSEEDTISNSIISSTGSLIDGVIVFYESKEDIRINYLQKNKILENLEHLMLCMFLTTIFRPLMT